MKGQKVSSRPTPPDATSKRDIGDLKPFKAGSCKTFLGRLACAVRDVTGFVFGEAIWSVSSLLLFDFLF